MIAFPAGVKVWIAGGVTDMRCGMNSLALKVQKELGRGLTITPFIRMAWRRHDRRLDGEVKSQVFTLKAIEIGDGYRGHGILTEFIRIVLESDLPQGSRCASSTSRTADQGCRSFCSACASVAT